MWGAGILTVLLARYCPDDTCYDHTERDTGTAEVCAEILIGMSQTVQSTDTHTFFIAQCAKVGFSNNRFYRGYDRTIYILCCSYVFGILAKMKAALN